MKKNLWNSCLVASILGIGLCHQASAVLVYDNGAGGNTVTGGGNPAFDLLTRFDPGASEVGDEIVLAGNQRLMRQFDFEFWTTTDGFSSGTPFAGPITARVRFYLNDGALFNGFPTPGTMFYDSGPFGVPSPVTPRSTFVFVPGADSIPAAGLLLPDTFTWSVQFTTVDPRDRAGVDLYSPPVIGQNYDDYWQRDLISGAWSLRTDPTGNVPFNFAARIQAVPEVTGIGICVMSFLGLVAFSRLTRRYQ